MRRFLGSQRFFLLTAFFIPFFVFLRTLSPTVNFGDTGELIVSAYTLGIPHPPGFPLWNLAAHPFSYLPFGSVAFRINLSSAFFSALTIFFLFRVILLLHALFCGGPPDLPSSFCLLFAVFSLAFSYSFWRVSIISEVYSLACLFSVFTLFSFLKFIQTKKSFFFCVLFFLLGTSLCVHYILLFQIPAFLFSLFFFRRIRSSLVPLALFFFLLGLAFFLYLPLRSLHNPPIDWGNPETLESFLAVVERRQFVPFDQVQLGISLPIKRPNSFLSFIKRAFSSLLVYFWIIEREFTVFGLLGGVLGIVFTLRSRLFFPLLIAFLLSGYAFAFAVAEPKPELMEEYVPYLSSFVYFSLFLSFGFLLSPRYLFKERSNLFLLVFLLLPLFLLAKNFHFNNFSQNRIALYHAQNILKTAGENSIIFAEENNWLFPLLYLMTVEEREKDIILYDRNGNLFEDIYQKSRRSLVEEVWEKERNKIEEEIIKQTKRQVFYAVDKRFENYHYRDATPAGILYQRGARKPLQVDFAQHYSNILQIEKLSFFDREAYYMIAHYHLQFAEDLIRRGEREKALEELEKAYGFGQFSPPLLNNLAVVYGKLGETNRAIQLYEEIILSFPNYIFAHQNLGTLYEKKGWWHKAEREYYQALQLQPNFIPSLLSLGKLMARKGKLTWASWYYQKVLSIDPDNQKAQQALENLGRLIK